MWALKGFCRIIPLEEEKSFERGTAEFGLSFLVLPLATLSPTGAI